MYNREENMEPVENHLYKFLTSRSVSVYKDAALSNTRSDSFQKGDLFIYLGKMGPNEYHAFQRLGDDWFLFTSNRSGQWEEFLEEFKPMTQTTLNL